MKNKTIVLIIVITALLVLTMLGTYAYLSVSDKQTTANTFNSGCLSVTIDSETNAISLTNSYPISDVEGVTTTPYTFTIKNNCSTAANYQINLENLNQTTNTLSSDYVKVSLSSDTNDNLISVLSSNDAATTTITGAYEAYTLYTGTIAGNGTTKTFNLREWIDYDVTVSQGANKTFTNKINVIANPEIEVTTTPEIQFTVNDTTLTGTINGTATTAKYCISNQNICTPQTSATIANNQINITLDRSKDQIVCVSLNSNDAICSNLIEAQKPITVQDILANKTISTRTDFSTILTTDTTGTIYSATDDDGTSYYYAGAPTDNWVKFAGFYWRIIRFNGDGSIRLIYNGTSTTGTGTGTQLSSISAFNSSIDNNAYVGLKYTTGSLRGTGTKSTILGSLESFYTSSLSSYASYLDTNTGFCGDRTPSTSSSSSNGSGGTGTTGTYYGAYIRLKTNKAPVLTCANSSDLYTTSSSSKGNKALTYPVGLITADEVAYAGGVYGTDNTGYYLYTNKYYWTLSPYRFSSATDTAYVFYVTSTGNLDYSNVDNTNGVRPVINLKTGTLFTAGTTGTASNPYEVIMN